MSYQIKSTVWLVTLAIIFIAYGYAYSGPDNLLIVFLFAVCFFSELFDSSVGMGYGTMLTPLLLFLGFTPKEIIPNLLVSELFTGFSAAFFHHQIKNVDIGPRGKHIKIALLLVLGSLFGVLGGVWIAVSIAVKTVVLLIGCITFFSGFVVLLFYNKVIIYKKWKIILLSIVASFNKAFSGGGYGPLVTSGQILSGIEGRSSVAITSFSEGFTCLFAVIVFYFYGVKVELTMLIPMLAGALASVPFSAYIVSLSSERQLRIIVGLLTMFLGGFTIYSAI